MLLLKGRINLKKDIDILVLGSLNMDLVIESDRAPYPGETLMGKAFFTSPGGKGNNQAIAAGRLGGRVVFVGCVGDDSYGSELINNLINNNVGVDGINKINDQSTGLAIINIFQGDNTIILHSGANARCITDELHSLEILISRARMLLMQLEIPIETVMKAIDITKRYGTKVILNPAPAIKLNDKAYKDVDYLILNEIESKILLGYDLNETIEHEKLIREFIHRGAKNIVITLGKDGALFNHEDKIMKQPSYKVNAVDSTGAGDAFIGGFCYALIRGLNIQEAVVFGSKTAAIKVTRMGAQKGLPTMEDIEDFKFSI